MMDVKVLRSAQQKKMKKFTINLRKTSAQMKNLMNMVPKSQTWVRLNESLKNLNKVKMEIRTQKKMMMKMMKSAMKMATESKKLDRKDKLNPQSLTTESSRDKKCTSSQSIIKVHTMEKVQVLFFTNLSHNLTRLTKITSGTGLSELAIIKSTVKLLNLKSKKKLACVMMKSTNYARTLTNNKLQALLLTHLY